MSPTHKSKRSSSAASPALRTVEGQLELFRKIFSESREAVALLVETREVPRIALTNDTFCRCTGLKPDESIGESIRCLSLVDLDPPLQALLEGKNFGDRRIETEVSAIRRDGSRYRAQLRIIPGEETGSGSWILYLHDVSEWDSKLALLEHQSLHDPLTGLPNKVLAADRLEQALLAGQRIGAPPVGLLFIDLDRFREINDTFGHGAGDRVLQLAGSRVRQQLRASDTVARTGGDEFACVLSRVKDVRAARDVAKKIIDAFKEPFQIGEELLEISVSIGIAMSPDHAGDAPGLLRSATVAMDHAKRLKLGSAVYDASQGPSPSTDLALTGELRRAIDNDELVLYYQPKVHIRSGLVTRLEALVRWNHPVKGLVFPDQFIPLAERTGLIEPLTAWVLDRSLQQCRDWHDRGMPIHLAINLSPQSLQQSFLPQTVSGLLEKWKIEPRYLKLEITESSILVDPPHVLAVLSLLQTLGVRLSLDDFGTGYSSLMHLRYLPFDEIKLDKSFIMPMLTNETDAAIVRAMIRLAHDLGRQVVAEGVDSEALYEKLRELECDLAQGYYVSPPLPEAELTNWLHVSRWGMSPTGVSSPPRRTMMDELDL